MAPVIIHARTNQARGFARFPEIDDAQNNRQFMMSIQGQLQPNKQSTKTANFQKNHSSKLPSLHMRHAIHALLGGTAFAAPSIFPAPVFAAAEQAAAQVTTVVTATTPQFSHTYHMVDDRTMCMWCMVLGTTFSVLTLATTGRFILSL